MEELVQRFIEMYPDNLLTVYLLQLIGYNLTISDVEALLKIHTKEISERDRKEVEILLVNLTEFQHIKKPSFKVPEDFGFFDRYKDD